MKVLREGDGGEPAWVDLDEWEDAMAGEKPKGRFCVDCVHHQEDYADLHICDRPVTDLVMGRERKLGMVCSDQRAGGRGESCGPEGKFWRPKAEPATASLGHPGPSFQEDDDGA